MKWLFAISIAVIITVACIILLVLLPKSKNFYAQDLYPELKIFNNYLDDDMRSSLILNELPDSVVSGNQTNLIKPVWLEYPGGDWKHKKTPDAKHDDKRDEPNQLARAGTRSVPSPAQPKAELNQLARAGTRSVPSPAQPKAEPTQLARAGTRSVPSPAQPKAELNELNQLARAGTRSVPSPAQPKAELNELNQLARAGTRSVPSPAQPKAELNQLARAGTRSVPSPAQPKAEPNEPAYEIYPFWAFGKFSPSRNRECPTLFELVKKIPHIKTAALIKVGGGVVLAPHSTWGEISNDTLRCVLPIISPSSDINKCGVWVEEETRALRRNEWVIYDSSKLCSIYNQKNEPVIMIMLDIMRHDKAYKGISEVPLCPLKDFTDKF